MAYRKSILAAGLSLFTGLALMLGHAEDSSLLLRSCASVRAAPEGGPYEAQPGRFTLAIIPDTQQYCQDWSAFPSALPRTRNPNLERAADWIIGHRQATNTVFVSHLGDIVDRNVSSRWNAAEASLDKILAAGIPMGIVVGNHDMEAHLGTAELFQDHFPEAKYKDFPWYGGSFPQDEAEPGKSGNNVNSFELISAGNRDIVLLHLECNAPDTVVDWANDVLDRHANRLAIILTHMWLGPLERPLREEDFVTAPKGRMQWVKCHGEQGNSGEALWEKLVRRHGNIALVLSGDQSQTEAMSMTSTGDAGNTVHQLMIDHGNGRYLRLLDFDLDQGKVDMVTWDVQTGERLLRTPRVTEPVEWQTTLPIDVRLRAREEKGGA